MKIHCKSHLMVLLLSASLIFFNSCKGSDSKSSKVSVKYAVSEPSTRLDENGNPDKLFVYFDSSVAKLKDSGGAPSSQITITPAISGNWGWLGDETLQFTPIEKWQLNTKYKVSMPSSIFSDNVKVKGDFSFKTEAFSVHLEDGEFYINPENPLEKRVTATINASHPMVKETVNNAVKMSLEYKNSKGSKERTEDISFKVSFNKNATEAYLVSANIPIPPYTSELKINLGKGVEAQVGGKSSETDFLAVSVPGMSDFVKLDNISTSLVKNNEQNYDQVISIETIGAVSPEELERHIVVYELPKDMPAIEGWYEKKNAIWAPDYVTDEVLKMADKIDISAIPSPEPANTLNSFKYKATPERFIYIKITGGINFFGGYKLNFDNDENVYEETIRVPRYPRELSIMSEGTILSLSGSRQLAIYSRGVDRVYYRLSRIMPKDVNHLVSMSNGDMRDFQFESYRFNENNIAESEISEYDIPNPSEETVSYFSYDFTSKLYNRPAKNLKNGLFLFQVVENKHRLGSYYPGVSELNDRRLILVTDLCFIVKHNVDESRDIFVQSISTGTPVQNARVRIVGLNGNTIAESATDFQGHAKLPSVYYSNDEHRPTAFVVETENDLSFMPYLGTGRSLDYSNFDTGGEYGLSEPERISAYMFSDRGMYRPGEAAHFGIIAKAGDWKIDLKGTPVEVEITDSNGSVVFNKRIQLSSSGFEGIDFATQEYSPTGYYNANLYLLKIYKDKEKREFLTSAQIKVEEFLPDTLSIATSFEPLPETGWINPGTLKGTVSLRNLFGTPAAGNNIKGQMFLTPGFPISSRYSDYSFYDPYSKDKSFEEFLGTNVTKEDGTTSFDLDISKFEKATYRLQFYAEGFEKASGRSVSSQSSIFVSPLKYMVGYKADGSLSYINADSVRKLSFIAINQKFEKIDLDDVVLKIEDIRYISTLVKQSNGLYKYQSVKKTYPVKEEKLKISKAGTDYIVPSDVAGEYKITLTDKAGLVFNTIEYTIVGDKNVSRSLTRTAELELKLQSGDLNPGSTAEVFIKAPYAGTGLITVERDHVYTYKWFKTNKLSTVQKITIPENLEGNGYINVMFTRDIASDEIFMSPFCYGAIPFSVGRARRTNKIKLNVPQEIKSGTDLNIEYSSSDSGRIVIMAVDEGILQVARYETPDPLAQFFKKRALEVRTSQILDLILPEFNVLKTLGATGGGADMKMLEKNLNPFKRKQNASVVFWSGIVETGPEKRTVKYSVPDYFNGNIRVMAVAVSKDKMGVAQTSTLAKNTFIISPNVPLAVAPGDEFDISVTVTNNHKGSGSDKISLKAVPSEHLKIEGEQVVSLTIDEGKDSTANFKVRAKEVLGAAEIRFTASDATESSSLSSTLSVRPSMPYQVWVKAGVSKNNKTEVDVNHRLYNEYSQRDVSVSNVPVSFIDGLSFYLEKYPYGCTEQITSKAYPYLYGDFIKAGGKTHAEAEQMVTSTIGIIQSRMKSDGNIGYWTSKSPVEPFITLYCAEFLVDAQKQDFYVPQALSTKIINAVRNIAEGDDDSRYGIYLRSYAIYILTKNDIVTTSLIERLESDISYKNFTPSDYEGLYLSASYAMLKQDKQATGILQKVKNRKTFDSSWFYHNSLHYISTYIDVIASYFPEKISDIKSKDVDELCKYLGNSYFNTMSTAAAIRAFESYSYTDKADVYKAFAIEEKKESEIALEGESVLKGTFTDDAKKIKFVSDKSMPLYYGITQAGYEKQAPSADVKDGLEVSREYLSEDGKKLDKIKVGDTITVKVSFRSKKGAIRNVAMIDMCPAGFETQIPSIREGNTGSWAADYVDIREDRIIIYGTVSENVNTFTYRAKVVNSGTFVVPPMFAEGMYNKDIRALSLQSPIKIEK